MHAAPSPPSPGARSIPTAGLVLVGDKEPFEVFGDVSQGLAVPLRRGARAGASCPPQLMALSFIFCLCAVWSCSGSEARCLVFWPALVAQDRGRCRQLPRSPVYPHVRRGARWASRLSCGGSCAARPPACVWLEPGFAASPGWSKASESPFVTFLPSQISGLGSRCGSAHATVSFPGEKAFLGMRGRERSFPLFPSPEHLGIGGSGNTPQCECPHTVRLGAAG